MTYKILNGAVLVDKEYFFTMNTSYSTRSNGFKIYKKFNKTSTLRFAFSQRIINNGIPYPMKLPLLPMY